MKQLVFDDKQNLLKCEARIKAKKKDLQGFSTIHTKLRNRKVQISGINVFLLVITTCHVTCQSRGFIVFF